MHTEATRVIEWLVDLGHLGSAMYLSGTRFKNILFNLV